MTAVMLLASAAGAQTQQVCHTSDIPLENTNWSHVATVPKFDSALGTLQTIQFTVTATVIGSAAEESLDSAPSNVTLQFSSMVMLTRPDGTVLDIAIPLASFSDPLSGFDGTLDYGGTSGVTHANITATNSTSFTSPPPASDIALFTGPAGNPGTIGLPVAAAGTSVATGSGNVITQFHQQASVHIDVCYTFLPNTPPTFTACNTSVAGSVGVQMTYQVCAVDSDPNDVVTITSVDGLPPGATFNPPLPVSGNPVCTTLTWTPAPSQVGATVLTFHATDTHMRTATCSLTLITAECHMLFATASGNSQHTIFGHLYDTQLAGVRRFFPVTMEDNPSFPFRLLPNTFFVQVVMYNPEMFPTNPSQWTPAMQVVKDSVAGTVNTYYVGNENGIGISALVYFDTNGNRRVRFPFVIH